MKNKNAILPAATLLTAIVLAPVGATAETIGTACLTKTGGELYALAPYRSSPSKKCRAGDQKVRVDLHQPGTSFAKRSVGVGHNDSIDILEFQSGDLIIILRSAEASRQQGNCELAIEDTVANTETVVTSVPRGEWRDGLFKVDHFDLDINQQQPAKSYEARRHTITDRNQALAFHDLLVDYRGGLCYASFVVEFAAFVEDLYEK